MNDEDIEAEDPSLAARRFWRTGVDAISEVKVRGRLALSRTGGDTPHRATYRPSCLPARAPTCAVCIKRVKVSCNHSSRQVR